MEDRPVASFPSGGQYPAFLTTINNGTELFIPNYYSGTIESVTLTNGGRSYEPSRSILQLVGSGPNLDRQASSHPYQVNHDSTPFLSFFSRMYDLQAVQNGGEILVPDLGADKVWRLVKNGTIWQVAGFVQHLAGSGPRHIALQSKYIYTFALPTNVAYP